MVTADVKVKGSDLPTSLCTTSGLTLVVIKERTMTTATTSGTDGTHALSTSLTVEDGREGRRHDDERSMRCEYR